MTPRTVVFLFLWQMVAPVQRNMNPKTFLQDTCDFHMICHELDVDSFQDYAIEFVWVKDDFANFEFVQSKNRTATKKLTPGDDWDIRKEDRTVCRHPIPGAENKMFVEFSSERVEVVKFYEEGKHLAVDPDGNKLFRIQSDFKDRQHVAVDDLKRSIIYNKWLFINSTHAIQLDRFMNFRESDRSILAEGGSRLGRIDVSHWSFGVEPLTAIPYEDIPSEFVELIAKNCFGNRKRYCAIDPRDGSIHYIPYPAVLRMGDFVMEQRWRMVLNDRVPIYRFHHIHMPENEVFYFSNIASLVQRLLDNGAPENNINGMWIRGVMPQPKEGDKIFELMLQRTTTTPSPAQSNTTPTSTLKPLPPAGTNPTFPNSISEDEEEPMPKFVGAPYRKKLAADVVGNAVAILLAILIISL